MSEGSKIIKELKDLYISPMGLPREEEKEVCKNLNIIEKELEEGKLAMTYVNAIFDILGDVRNGDLMIDIIAKQRKALEIIKNKKVQVATLILSNSCNGYNFSKGLLGEFLTEEEYDLVKEILL